MLETYGQPNQSGIRKDRRNGWETQKKLVAGHMVTVMKISGKPKC